MLTRAGEPRAAIVAVCARVARRVLGTVATIIAIIVRSVLASIDTGCGGAGWAWRRVRGRRRRHRLTVVVRRAIVKQAVAHARAAKAVKPLRASGAVAVAHAAGNAVGRICCRAVLAEGWRRW